MADVADLVDVLTGAESLAIVCHDDPDPDCIASALALRRIASAAGVETVDIRYGGEISHQQNRAFVNLLDLELASVADFSPENYERIAFVDHSSVGRNVALPEDPAVDVVVDHHPSDASVEASYVDVRESYGATASILVEYLRELSIEPDERLAGALLFAIHRECVDYVRGPTAAEYAAVHYLFPLADRDLVEHMYGAAFTRGTIDAMGRAIRTRETRGSALVASTGRTGERDALPQAAEFLLNLEGVETVLVLGVVDDAIHLSGRSIDDRVDLGRVLDRAFGEVGTAGGHHDSAGGRVPLGLFADVLGEEGDQLVEFVERRVRERFFGELGLEEEELEE